jgi:hypothetical protein
MKGADSFTGSAPLLYSVIRALERLLSVLYLINNGLEGFGVVKGEVSKNLTVDFDAGLVNETHELRVRKIL